ncbi:hypothetical protein WN982_26375 [Paraburkholderia sp. IMGN_8]|uniref:hypothetical protein n=1 Tax=Paraburkholderia sp. IMGN_8 TaxID=3136564 RepID=UPI0031010D1A
MTTSLSAYPGHASTRRTFSPAATGAADNRLAQKTTLGSSVKKPGKAPLRDGFERLAPDAIRRQKDGMPQRISSALQIVCIQSTPFGRMP